MSVEKDAVVKEVSKGNGKKVSNRLGVKVGRTKGGVTGARQNACAPWGYDMQQVDAEAMESEGPH